MDKKNVKEEARKVDKPFSIKGLSEKELVLETRTSFHGDAPLSAKEGSETISTSKSGGNEASKGGRAPLYAKQERTEEKPGRPQEMPRPKERPGKEGESMERPQGEAPKPAEEQKKAKSPIPGMKLFGVWDLSAVKVEDPGLRRYINLRPVMVPRSGGRYAGGRFYKSEASIVERFMNKLAVPGHRGKKHKLTSGHCPGGKQGLMRCTREAFKLIEERTKQNPVQVLVRAIENSSILEEVAAYRMGGIIARNAVVVSPKRRLDIALRYITQGIFRAGFKSKSTLPETIARELIAASNNDSKSFPIIERNRIEKEAEGAR